MGLDFGYHDIQGEGNLRRFVGAMSNPNHVGWGVVLMVFRKDCDIHLVCEMDRFVSRRFVVSMVNIETVIVKALLAHMSFV